MTTHHITGTLLAVLLIAGFIWATFGLNRMATKVHGDLNEFKRRAVRADCYFDLLDVQSQLRDYAKKNCLHKQFAAHAREVDAYIQGAKEKYRKNP